MTQLQTNIDNIDTSDQPDQRCSLSSIDDGESSSHTDLGVDSESFSEYSVISEAFILVFDSILIFISSGAYPNCVGCR